ncbi:hypothetical protein BaRGS_00038924, partial [Batillaria attramentaria]
SDRCNMRTVSCRAKHSTLKVLAADLYQRITGPQNAQRRSGAWPPSLRVYSDDSP